MTITPLLEHDRCALFYGDSKNLSEVLPENSIDAIVTDPPAGIGFMGRSWDDDHGGRAEWVAWLADLMRSAFQVLKPGGYALVWAIPRTSHWTAWALEDAGFEIRDVHHDMIAIDDALLGFIESLDDVQRAALARILESQSSPILYQVFGSGFPKSMDLAREYDMRVCELAGRHYDKSLPKGAKAQPGDHLCPAAPDRDKYAGRTALKPAVEHWILARKPLDGTVIENVVKHGTGRLNVDGCRIEGRERTEYGLANAKRTQGSTYGAPSESADFDSSLGRWPAHISLDETTAAIMDEQSGVLKSGDVAGSTRHTSGGNGVTHGEMGGVVGRSFADSGGASRFFFVRSSECSSHVKDVATSSTPRSPDSGSADDPVQDATTVQPGSSSVGVRYGSSGRSTNGMLNASNNNTGTSTPMTLCTERKCSPESMPIDMLKISPAANVEPSAPIDTTTITPDPEMSSSSVDPVTSRSTSKNSEPGVQGSVEASFRYVAKAPRKEKEAGLEHLAARTGGEATGREDGSAGLTNPRAGAGRTGGAKNHHPTVKSVALMQWLCRLVTPPGGVILDPFAGSGTTGVAALTEGFSFIGCELGGEDGEYLPIVVGRLRHALGLPPEAPEVTLTAVSGALGKENPTILKAPDPSAGFSGSHDHGNNNP